MTENPEKDWAFNFYSRYYQAIASSRANGEYCRRLFGADMAQHGFAEVPHIDHLVQAAGIGPTQRVLDLGCGNGKMIEYISDQTGAKGVGIDFMPAAVEQALERTSQKRNRLDFRVMDLTRLVFPPASFDAVISVDTLYFTDDLPGTMAAIFQALRPRGVLQLFTPKRGTHIPIWRPILEKSCSLTARTWLGRRKKWGWRINTGIIQRWMSSMLDEKGRFPTLFEMILPPREICFFTKIIWKKPMGYSKRMI